MVSLATSNGFSKPSTARVFSGMAKGFASVGKTFPGVVRNAAAGRRPYFQGFPAKFETGDVDHDRDNNCRGQGGIEAGPAAAYLVARWAALQNCGRE